MAPKCSSQKVFFFTVVASLFVLPIYYRININFSSHFKEVFGLVESDNYVNFSLVEKLLHATDNESASFTTSDFGLQYNIPRQSDLPSPQPDKKIHIAVGGALSLKKLKFTHMNDLTKKYHLLTRFLPSFCRTVSVGRFQYDFYFAYDSSDPVLKNLASLQDFQVLFLQTPVKFTPYNFTVCPKTLRCDYESKPAWSQNDGMMHGYMEGADYFFRVNDDTEFVTKSWTEEFIKTLASYSPPNVGVVGPTFDYGNTAILTYDFVHKTHVEIFGFYYPRGLTDWYADDWITKVYRPKRSTKLKHIKVKHTHELGTRYHPIYSNGKIEAQVRRTGIKWLERYIVLKNATHENQNGSRYVILLSIQEITKSSLYGAVRNAELAKIFFPGWRVRAVVSCTACQETTAKFKYVFDALRRIGVDVLLYRAPSSAAILTILHYRHVVTAILNSTEDRVMVRDAEFRFTERESITVSEWLKTNASFHCIRDHKTHVKVGIAPKLWDVYLGSSKDNIFRLLKNVWRNYSSRFHGTETGNFEDFLYDELNRSEQTLEFICHDSISNPLPANSVRSQPFSEANGYISQKYNENMLPVINNINDKP